MYEQYEDTFIITNRLDISKRKDMLLNMSLVDNCDYFFYKLWETTPPFKYTT